MTENTRTVAVIKGQLSKFSGIVAKGLPKAKQRLIKEMLYGSEHEMGEGYWQCKAVAADVEHKTVIPLYLKAHSQEAKDVKSENDQIFKVIDTVSTYTGKKGAYPIDRGVFLDSIDRTRAHAYADSTRVRGGLNYGSRS